MKVMNMYEVEIDFPERLAKMTSPGFMQRFVAAMSPAEASKIAINGVFAEIMAIEKVAKADLDLTITDFTMGSCARRGAIYVETEGVNRVTD